MRLHGLGSSLLALILAVGIAAPAVQAVAQEKQDKKAVKRGLEPADWAYKLGNGIVRREVTYYSDDVPCFAVLFFPKNYSTTGKTPGVVLGQGWAGTHYSIEKYGARFAEKGLVAMVIDYRGWGLSDGFTTLAEKVKNTDDVRFTRTKAEVIVKRTRLIPLKQVEDVRNAVSYLQGEAGVDAERIGVWGSSFAAGNSIVAAAQDARIKVIATQVPSIAGKKSHPGPYQLQDAMLEDAIKRARLGQGAELTTGYSTPRKVDAETTQFVAEYRPFHSLKHVGVRPVLFIVAQNEELIKNSDNAYAASQVLTGPTKVIEIPNISHFEMYIGEAFEVSSNAAADWFREHFGMNAPR